MHTIDASTMRRLIDLVGLAITAIDATPVDAPNRTDLAMASGRLEFVQGVLLKAGSSDG